jgi:hypothetical protein
MSTSSQSLPDFFRPKQRNLGALFTPRSVAPGVQADGVSTKAESPQRGFKRTGAGKQRKRPRLPRSHNGNRGRIRSGDDDKRTETGEQRKTPAALVAHLTGSRGVSKEPSNGDDDKRTRRESEERPRPPGPPRGQPGSLTVVPNGSDDKRMGGKQRKKSAGHRRVRVALRCDRHSKWRIASGGARQLSLRKTDVLKVRKRCRARS